MITATMALGVALTACVTDVGSRRIPNVLTLGGAAAALVFHAVTAEGAGIGTAAMGWLVGTAVFLPFFLLGGMGAGDVKLMAGIGAWLGAAVTFYAFCVTVVVGAVMALLMVLAQNSFRKHYKNFLLIWIEWWTIRNPRELSKIAADRKSKMFLLPYGIPICIGSIAYFLYAGMN